MIGHPTVAEIYAGEGFDWVCGGMEHTSTDLRSLHEIALAPHGTNCDLFVRMPDSNQALAKPYLDTGANDLVVPQIHSAEQAKKAVSIARSPPREFAGRRSVGLAISDEIFRATSPLTMTTCWSWSCWNTSRRCKAWLTSSAFGALTRCSSVPMTFRLPWV